MNKTTMNQSLPSEHIRHFTDVCALFSILEEGFIFSKPNPKWDDQNDNFVLTEYGKRINKDVYVLCFCDGIGNIHHWTYFGSQKPSETSICYKGIKCNIKINRKKFEEYLSNMQLPPLQQVKYAASNEIAEILTTEDILPFLKRKEYDVEKEWRIVITQKKGSKAPKPLRIPIDSIEGINILMDRNSKQLFGEIKKKLESAYPYLQRPNMIDFNGSFESQKWQEAVSKVLQNLINKINANSKL